MEGECVAHKVSFNMTYRLLIRLAIALLFGMVSGVLFSRILALLVVGLVISIYLYSRFWSARGRISHGESEDDSFIEGKYKVLDNDTDKNV